MPSDQAGGNMKIVRGSEGVKEKGQSSSKVDGFQGGYTQRTSARPSGQNARDDSRAPQTLRRQKRCAWGSSSNELR